MPKYGIFGPKFRHFYFFRETLQKDKFEGADFQSNYIFFEILGHKNPNKAFLVKNTQN